ncbi:MAG: hypothetical protein Q9202_002530 [Teloschistes flavicans]
MANHLVPQTGEDLPSQSYRYQGDQSRMGYEGGLRPYADTEADGDRHHEQDIMGYYQSMNESAVSSNSYVPLPDWSGGRLPTNLGQHGYNGHASRPQPRRGSPVYGSLPSPSSLQPSLHPTSFQSRGSKLQSSAQTPTLETHERDGDRNIENDHSDLEEGELSEGPDNNPFKGSTADVPHAILPPQLNANNEGHRFVLRSGQRHSPYLDRPMNKASTHNHNMARPVREGRPHSIPSATGVTYKAGSRTKQNNSPKTTAHPDDAQRDNRLVRPIKDRAIRALKELQAHDIGYTQLLAEHLHAEYLRKLYYALSVEIPQHPEASKDSAELPSYKTHFEPTPSAPNIPANGLPITLAGAALITSTPAVQSMSNRVQESIGEVDLHQTMTASSNHALQLQSQLGQAQRMPLEKNGISDRSTSQATVGSPVRLATENSSEKLLSSAPSMHNDHVAATQILPQNPTQNAATEATTKPPASKAAVKTLDRKDYIARLLAAKAGKAVPVMSTPKPPLDVVSNKKPDLSSQYKNQASEILENETQSSSSNRSQDKSLALPDAPVKSTPVSNQAAEAKRREQTELARRKIEELKKRVKESTEVRPPSSGMSAMSGGEETVQSPGSSVKNPAKPVVRLIRGSQVSQDLPQHPYFSPHDGSFTIPGLFMSPSHSQPDGSIEPLDITTAPNLSFDYDRANTKPSITTPRDSPSSRSDLVFETSIPSTGTEGHTIKTSLGETGPSKVTVNARKRPTAADFIESLPSKVRKVDHRKADYSVIIEVSDDDRGDSGNEDSDMQPGDDGTLKPMKIEDTLTSRPASKAQTHGSSSSTQSDFQVKLEHGNNQRSNAGQSLQKSLKDQDPAGLRSKEEEIERMNRKIAEMEQRRKARQSTALRQVSEILAHQPSDRDAAAQATPSTKHHGSKPDGLVQDEIPKTGVDPNIEPVLFKEVPNEERWMTADEIGALECPGEDFRAAVVATDEQQHQPQGNDVTSNVRSTNAAVQTIMAKLQSVQKEEADLQAQVQRMIDTRRSLLKELEQLKQEPSSNPQAPAKWLAETETTETARECIQQEHRQAPPIQPPADKAHERHRRGSSTVNQEDATSEGSTPIAASLADTPIKQPLLSDEHAENVMDVSGSEDEGLVLEHDAPPNADRAPLANDSSDEEPYEPPASFRNIEEDLLVGTHSRQPDTRSREISQPLAPRASDIRLMVASEAKKEGQLSVTCAVGAALEPGRPQSAGDLSESDDYEPPEPTTPVEAASITHTAADPLSASSSLAPVTDEIVEPRSTSLDSHSALSVQAAVDDTGTALIDSEKMGTIPKGLSPEQHDIFVVGLRKIIQEIRGRKVKDFKTVASEIAAYRARFLGDSSKILPL